jgi:hypothetical protein
VPARNALDALVSRALGCVISRVRKGERIIATAIASTEVGADKVVA